MIKLKKLTVLSGILALSIIVSSLPAIIASAKGVSEDQEEAIPVLGSYSSSADHRWQSLDTVLFEKDKNSNDVNTVITVDPSTKYQEYQGIGVSLDETSVSNLWKLSTEDREAAIKNLVEPVNGAGIGLFRLTIGSPDCIEHLPFWSYDELPAGVTDDFDLKYFSIEKDKTHHIIDTIKLIQKYNSNAQFFGSAWSAPSWMKTIADKPDLKLFTGYVEPKGDGSGYFQANKLRDDCINVFARYYVKTIQAFAKEGINIRAITLLNEPGMDVVYPAMDISITQQQLLALEIKKEFKNTGLNTELWMHDFNFWDWKDPNSTQTKNYYRVFEDSTVAKGADVLNAADGIAFHPYWGDPSVMADAAKKYPNLNIHLTESGSFSPTTVLEDFNQYASSYTAWVPVTDQNGGTLHWTGTRNNNVDWNSLPQGWTHRLINVNTETKTVTYENTLYGLGQFAKYLVQGGVKADGSIQKGARRIFSTGTINGISNVTFQNPDGQFVMVLINGGAAQKVKVYMMGKSFVENIPANSTTTLRWNPEISPDNNRKAPVLENISNIIMDQYETKTLQLQTVDKENYKLMYYGINLPNGVAVDYKTGFVTLKPTNSGTFRFSLVASNGYAKDSKDIELTVNKKATPIDRYIIEAEDYVAQYGWQDGGSSFVESNGNASGGKDVGWTSAGKWLKYYVNVPATGTYTVEFGVANGNGSDSINAISLRDANANVLCIASVPSTQGWANWTTVKAEVQLSAGDQYITLYCNKGGFNFDYMKFTAVTGAAN
jgi:glucosylceramidase